MNLLDSSPERVRERERAKQIQAAQMGAQQLIDFARQYDLVVTINLAPRTPPAIGSYDMVFDVREARNGAA